MKIISLAKISPKEFTEIETKILKHKTLGQVLSWAAQQPKGEFIPQVVAEVITQDEFTHDVVIPYKNLFLVYDTT